MCTVMNVSSVSRPTKKCVHCVVRRCMNRVFNDYGVFHFVSKSFDPAVPSANISEDDSEAQQSSVDDLLKRISTVIIDEDESDSFTIRVDSKGFHPSNVAVRKVQIYYTAITICEEIIHY